MSQKDRNKLAFVYYVVIFFSFFTARCTQCQSSIAKSSVRLTVCLSVRNVDVPLAYRLDQFKINYTNNQLRVLFIGATTSAIQSKGNTPEIPRGTPLKFGWNRGRVALLSSKPAISLKRGKIEPRLLLMTNRKSHTRFRLVPKSMTLDDHERPLCTLFQNTWVFGAHHENVNEDRPKLSTTKMQPNDSRFWQ